MLHIRCDIGREKLVQSSVKNVGKQGSFKAIAVIPIQYNKQGTRKEEAIVQRSVIEIYDFQMFRAVSTHERVFPHKRFPSRFTDP